ncbi:hypothetical protein Tpen_1281 [Thermofilum pendens Hrk 5]|uniref:Uncharacterized protein n=1 Tax=Thermofilum pendens (strain DSM 2475 / Hrk 5) TaxID=368408 RepID=A1RZP9_THEPD|nr:hypothetical protein Tpen_1281 [Thermofilum pendens Hrk 5]
MYLQMLRILEEVGALKHDAKEVYRALKTSQR